MSLGEPDSLQYGPLLVPILPIFKTSQKWIEKCKLECKVPSGAKALQEFMKSSLDTNLRRTWHLQYGLRNVSLNVLSN